MKKFKCISKEKEVFILCVMIMLFLFVIDWFIIKIQNEKLKYQNICLKENLKKVNKIEQKISKIELKVDQYANWFGIKERTLFALAQYEQSEEIELPDSWGDLYYEYMRKEHSPGKYTFTFDYSFPVNNAIITSEFGYRWIRRKLDFHLGVDAYVKENSKDEKVHACQDGIVIKTGYDSYEGNYIIIQHKYFYSYYGHLKKILIKEKQATARGGIIGIVGNTGFVLGKPGTHLHFGLFKIEDKHKRYYNPFKDSSYGKIIYKKDNTEI